jgi:hypothetical protein
VNATVAVPQPSVAVKVEQLVSAEHSTVTLVGTPQMLEPLYLEQLRFEHERS